MAKCNECGLLKTYGKDYCVRLKKEIPRGEADLDRDCNYFYKKITEAGETLSPEEHLLMQDMEIKSKKLKMNP